MVTVCKVFLMLKQAFKEHYHLNIKGIREEGAQTTNPSQYLFVESTDPCQPNAKASLTFWSWHQIVAIIYKGKYLLEKKKRKEGGCTKRPTPKQQQEWAKCLL